MFYAYLYSLLSVLAISLISLISVFALAFKEEKLKRVLFFLVAFAAGGLFGDVFIHLAPEIVRERGFNLLASFGFLAGILAFFVLEKFLAWRHCHDIECREHHDRRLGRMNLIGDGFHNLLDGMLVAGSFLVNAPTGIATAMAVLLHEIPQEIGDFAILIHSGYSKKRALAYNLLSGLVALLGAAIILIIGNRVAGLSQILLPFTGGSFIYIAGSGIIPELHKESGLSKSLLQLLGLILGVGIMLALLLLNT